MVVKTAIEFFRRAFIFYRNKFNRDTGEMEFEETAGSATATEQFAGSVGTGAIETIATITEGFKGLVTFLYVDVTSSTDDFVLQENGDQLTGGVDRVRILAAATERKIEATAGSLEAPVLELAAGDVDIFLDAASPGDAFSLSITIKEVPA